MTAIPTHVGPVRTIRKIKINGQLLSTEVSDQITDGTIHLSVSSEPRISFTVIDHPDMPLTAQLAKLIAEGTTMGWENNIFALSRFSVEGSATAPMITAEGTAETVFELMHETGGKNWGETDVTSWAKGIIRSAGSIPVVQPDLGRRQIERKEDEQVPENGETTWDTLAETAKKVGAWVFENGERIVFGKPSWVIRREDTRQIEVVWNSWTDHTDGLTAVPAYEWDWKNKPWEGRERLSLEFYEPPTGAVTTDTLHYLRPGDVVQYTGRACPSKDPVWVVTDVARPLYTGAAIQVQCVRPIDPPEIQDSSPLGEGGEGTAGVPTGPLGSMGWQGEQLKNAAEIVRAGQRRQLNEKAMILAVQTAMAESSLIVKPYGDAAGPDSRGLFQQRALWGPLTTRMNPAKSAGLFYDALLNLGDLYLTATDGPSSSAVIHRVQGNQDPLHYVRFWPDAVTVTKACLEAKETGEAMEADGDLGERIRTIMDKLNGKSWDVDGAFGAQCYDLAQKYLTELTGIGMIYADGIDFYRHPDLLSKFTPIPPSKRMRKGDIITWGKDSDFPNFINGKYRGHVAIYSHHAGAQNIFLTQNPGAAHYTYLNPRGILGYMRPKG